MTEGRLNVCDLDLVDHDEALRLQRSIRERRINGMIGDTLLLLEHPPTITLGRRSQPGDLIINRERLEYLGVDLAEVERGGRATYHGPGQVVAYVIISLKERRLSVPSFVKLLEQSSIGYLSTLGIEAGRRRGRTGVWVGRRKIGAVGVHLRRWVSLYGFALNVDPDLTHYEAIVPCGLPDADMTSVRRELGRAPSLGQVKRGVAESVSQVFQYGGVDWTDRMSLRA